jgi:hypothetical protein
MNLSKSYKAWAHLGATVSSSSPCADRSALTASNAGLGASSPVGIVQLVRGWLAASTGATTRACPGLRQSSRGGVLQVVVEEPGLVIT